MLWRSFDVMAYFFDVMAYVLMSCRKFRCYGVLFDAMAYFLDIMKSL